jgi:hypothetical protein
MRDRAGALIGRFDRRNLGVFDRRIPFDRLRPANERMLDHLTHARDRNDLHVVLHVIRNLRQVLGVLFRDQHLLDAAAKRREQLFLETADRQDPAAQRHLRS